MLEVGKWEELRCAKAARVPEEPKDGTPRVLVLAQHPFQGRVTKFFLPTEKMVAVYDWLGSLDLQPEHFSVQVQPSQVISPEENIFLYEGVVLYMHTLDKPIPMGISSPELSFKGFGTVSATDDNYMYNCPSPSALDFQPLPEVQLPQLHQQPGGLIDDCTTAQGECILQVYNWSYLLWFIITQYFRNTQ